MTAPLSPDLQAVLELTRQEYTEVQIAQQLGIPGGTVKSRRATLRKRTQLAKLPRGGARPIRGSHPPLPISRESRSSNGRCACLRRSRTRKAVALGKACTPAKRSISR